MLVLGHIIIIVTIIQGRVTHQTEKRGWRSEHEGDEERAYYGGRALGLALKNMVDLGEPVGDGLGLREGFRSGDSDGYLEDRGE